MSHILLYFKNPIVRRVGILKRLFWWLPDKTYVKILYRIYMGKWPDLKRPRLFSEKLQWLKLYNRRPEYTDMVDKYEAKKIVAEKIGEQFIIPTLGVWSRPEDIDWDKLPKRFVLKCTHDSGTVIIIKDKEQLDKQKTINRLRTGLRRNYYRQNKEWPYKNVPRRIIAETFIENGGESEKFGCQDLPDYKFFCFNGEPLYCQVITGRKTKMCIDFYNKDWNHQPFHEPKQYPFADKEPQKPQNYDQMWCAARKLADGHPFVRIDFYEANGKVFFGEITFYPTSGIGGFAPENYDEIFGQYIQLPASERL